MSNPIFISPSLAARFLAVSERSVRRAIKRKELAAPVRHGRYQIDFQQVILWSEKMPNRTRKRDSYGIGQYVREWRLEEEEKEEEEK